ncbi:hypothetical protein HNP46_000413 [Pseudomonas nitritireducens]|uniref:GmrSD restriction endonucleases N-terminal domain-containing protein n=1 Tax=Pseudomonas nitroreducens TaxID=46680 RepID=A0A7W7KEY0_PSENT|nr:DUF262 domain-containing protein [Pseudomonas nitritireducens]MBB4861602.1 hypothetical protein [Pseudomonas nitritireducens]
MHCYHQPFPCQLIPGQLDQLLENGVLRAATYTRPYSWTRQNVELFMDSIMRHFPLGAISVWAPGEEYFEEEQVRPYLGPESFELGSTPKALVIDGYARLATLLWVMHRKVGTKAPTPEESAVWTDGYTLVLDFESRAFKFVPDKELFTGLRIPSWLLKPIPGEGGREMHEIMERRRKVEWAKFDGDVYREFQQFVFHAQVALNRAMLSAIVVEWQEEDRVEEYVKRANFVAG